MSGGGRVGDTHENGNIQQEDGRTMIEYLYLACLLCLTISVPILIRGCFKIHHELPTQGGHISEKIDGVSEVLNELADFIADLARNGLFDVASSHTQPDFLTLLTAFLKRDTPSPSQHGTKEQENWEVLPPDPTQKNETETILDEHGAVNPDSERNE